MQVLVIEICVYPKTFVSMQAFRKAFENLLVRIRDGNRIDDFLPNLIRKKTAMGFFDAMQIRIMDAIFSAIIKKIIDAIKLQLVCDYQFF